MENHILQSKLRLVLLQVAKCFVPVQNVLSQPNNLTAFSAFSKSFVPAQKLILLNSNHLSATICKWFFVQAQKIWTSPKHFGTCKRTRQKSLIYYHINSGIK